MKVKSVIKIGGPKDIDYNAFCEDCRKLWENERFVLVHGANQELNALSNAVGYPPKMVTSVSGFESRFTDEKTMELFTMAYSGKVNKMLVSLLQKQGVNAVGLSALDGRIAEGRRKKAVKVIENGKKKVLRGDYTGKVERINTRLLELLLKNDFLPVLCPPAISYESELINVDGDRLSAELAIALKAENLILLSNIPGLLKDVNDENSLIKNIHKEELQNYTQFAKGRMKKKLMGANEALQGGVGRVVIADARKQDPISNALQGNGSVIE